jgi:glutathione S-transferase
MLIAIAAGAVTAGTTWFLREKSLRRTRPMRGGLDETINLPHLAEFELWHNAFSLCSKKVRLCLAELGVPCRFHHVDLIETGSYQTLSRRFLAVNPAALVPVLVHNGHPVYESHEIIRYAAAHSADGNALVPEDARDLAVMDRWVHKSSLFGDDPVAAIAESAGNCVPGLTIPLFAAMIADIPPHRIVEGLLFHRLKQRPMFFLLLKAAGLSRLPSLPPVLKAVCASREQMERHLGELETHLAAGPGPWIVGDRFTLADVSWAVIFDRLREADWTDLLENPRRPHIARWWQLVSARPSCREAMGGPMEHPLVKTGTQRIVALKAADAKFRNTLYGDGGSSCAAGN